MENQNGKIREKDIEFYKKVLYFIKDYKIELEELQNFLDSKLSHLDETEEDLKVFIKNFERIYHSFGPSPEVDNFFRDNQEKFGLIKDRKIIRLFKRIMDVENKLG